MIKVELRNGGEAVDTRVNIDLVFRQTAEPTPDLSARPCAIAVHLAANEEATFGKPESWGVVLSPHAGPYSYYHHVTNVGGPMRYEAHRYTRAALLAKRHIKLVSVGTVRSADLREFKVCRCGGSAIGGGQGHCQPTARKCSCDLALPVFWQIEVPPGGQFKNCQPWARAALTKLNCQTLLKRSDADLDLEIAALVFAGAACVVGGAIRGVVNLFADNKCVVVEDTQTKRYAIQDGPLLRAIPEAALHFFLFTGDKRASNRIGNVDRCAAQFGVPIPEFFAVYLVDGRCYVSDVAPTADGEPVLRRVDDVEACCFNMAEAKTSFGEGAPPPTEARRFNTPSAWNHAAELHVTIYENERYFVGRGYRSGYSLTDRPPRSLRNGAPVPDVPPGCEYIESDWQRVPPQPGVTDGDGWQYAFDFPQRYSAHCAKTDFVRRRPLFRTIRGQRLREAATCEVASSSNVE